MSYDAYAHTQRETAEPRDVEYRAFAKTTRGLMDAVEGDAKAVGEALHVNRSLWETLAADCANDANQLPLETRSNIVGLARWVREHSRRALRDPSVIGDLIEINKIMMDGLAGKRTEKSAAPAKNA
ncbi:MAG: flagellar biosynthesis regulator FlaF [Pseudomonadota bacterium]